MIHIALRSRRNIDKTPSTNFYAKCTEAALCITYGQVSYVCPLVHIIYYMHASYTP